jgi:hypothetical protein
VKKKTTTRRRTRRRGISRIDQPSKRTYGWFARAGFYRRKDGAYVPKHRKFFGDATWGGKRLALKAAEKYLDKVDPSRRKRPRARRRAA